jgi:hypothetical protein
MEPSIVQIFADHGVAGVGLYFLWRLTEKVGSMAEAFAACGAKMDSLLVLLGKDGTQ